jgi:hypothetical protein
MEDPDSPFRGSSTVLRAARINVDLNGSDQFPESLAFILDRTDEELEEVAKLCGAEVVAHEWALLHDPEGSRASYRPRRTAAELLPESYVLVAEVDVIRGALRLDSIFAKENFSTTASRVKDGVREYHANEAGWMLTDMGTPQFVVSTGSDEAVSDEDARPILVDIEPRVEFVD